MVASGQDDEGASRRKRSARALSGRVFQILVAALLLVLVTDGVMTLIAPAEFRSVRSSAWDEVWSEPEDLPGQVRLALTVKDKVLTAAYEVRLPQSEKLFSEIRHGGGAQDPQGLADLFGTVDVDGIPIVFRAPSLDVKPTDPDGRILLRSIATPLMSLQPKIRVRPSSLQRCCIRGCFTTAASRCRSHAGQVLEPRGGCRRW
jgi:hypothetical protein